ncbi:hypothetical protein [Microbulbifer donghaiensis]|uniref:hypothetical protein n=1 Tax=Microbulbifer donghaiensis TaxID=494016 RepID=UPI001160ECDB|nr:hypothetical protein [Microbulbifer donghaiensis]
MNKKYSKLLSELIALRELLIADGDSNWVRGVDLVIQTLSSGNPDSLQKAFEIYTRMNSGKESFADYFCWDSDRKVMDSRNNALKNIKSNIRQQFSVCAKV